MLIDPGGKPIQTELEPKFKAVFGENRNVIAEIFTTLSDMLFATETKNALQVIVQPIPTPEGEDETCGYYFCSLATMVNENPEDIRLLMQANVKVTQNEEVEDGKSADELEQRRNQEDDSGSGGDSK